MKDYKMDSKKYLDQTGVYKMVQVTKKVNLTPRAIRYYESEGLLGDVKRSIGYTRYYSDDDVSRLFEIKTLKNQGKKIAQIKALFIEKYSTQTDTLTHSITIEDAFIEESDVGKCQAMGIQIQPLSLKMNGITMDYLKWKSVDINTFLAPFDILVHGTNRQIQCSGSWLGNAKRSVINATLKQHHAQPLTDAWVANEVARCIEWVMMPVQVNASGVMATDLLNYVVLEKRIGQQIERHVMPLDGAMVLFEKQFKQMVVAANGRVMFVTVHRTKKQLLSDTMEASIRDLVANKNRLSIEDMGPIYLKTIGTTDAVLISALPGA